MQAGTTVASWSPGSIWESYERARDTPFEGNGTHMDIGKNGAKKRPLERMRKRETPERRIELLVRRAKLLKDAAVEVDGIAYD